MGKINETGRQTLVKGSYVNANNETYGIQYTFEGTTISKFSVTITDASGNYLGNANFEAGNSSISVRDQSTLQAHTDCVNLLYAEAVAGVAPTETETAATSETSGTSETSETSTTTK